MDITVGVEEVTVAEVGRLVKGKAVKEETVVAGRRAGEGEEEE